jgi:hypothetical protein
MDVIRGLGRDTLLRIIKSNITDYGEEINEDMIIEEVEETLRNLQAPLYRKISQIDTRYPSEGFSSMHPDDKKNLHEAYAEIRGINKVAEALGLELNMDDNQDDVDQKDMDPTPLKKGPR